MQQKADTVVKPPGLSSPCTMQCCQGLLTAFGVGFTPHIQCKTGTDLLARPHAIDTLWHLAIAPIAPLHRVRGGGQQLVIEKREGFVQRKGQEFPQLSLSRLKLAGPPTPRDTEASNAYAIIHDSLGPVCICRLIGINSAAT